MHRRNIERLKVDRMRGSKKKKLLLIAGPCVIEDAKTTSAIAEYLSDVCARYPVEFIFKSSYYKANRTALSSYRGPGLTRGLRILRQIKKRYNVSVISDVHCREDIPSAAKVLDVIQIPAFLSRQTDLLLAAARTGKAVNIKKAQFMAPDDVRYVIEKIVSTGNRNIFLTERGTCFGYHNLVVDFRSFLIMKEFGYPVIYDVTHSLQRPSSAKGISGGDSGFVFPMALSGIACGVDGLFLEVHPRPARARSDKATSYPLSGVEMLLKKCIQLRKVLHEEG